MEFGRSCPADLPGPAALVAAPATAALATLRAAAVPALLLTFLPLLSALAGATATRRVLTTLLPLTLLSTRRAGLLPALSALVRAHSGIALISLVARVALILIRHRCVSCVQVPA
jgi:hypothetical protein